MLRFHLKEKLQPCISPVWARTGHLQTILGHLLPSPVLTKEGERIELKVSSDDVLVSHFLQGTSDTVVYLFHGLAGFSHGTYMQRTALVAQGLGHSVFLFNHRGCGAGSGLAREPYHSGRAEDLSALIEYGRNRFPHQKHVAIGFSLSGNAVLLLAAGQRAKVLPDAAIAVNAPINLGRASIALKQGLNRIYDYRFVRDIKKEIAARSTLDVTLKDIQLPVLATVHDLDDLYTATAGGFKNREDYYATCSAKQFLNDLKIPTVLITAKDDPFVSYEDYLEAKLSPLAQLHIENQGGHMGYLTSQASSLHGQRWLDYALWSYLKSLET